MEAKLFFITGVCGVGKSSIIQPLRTLLSEKFKVHDFDERGVPAGADRTWRLAETQHWLSLGREKARMGISTIVCGFTRPSELEGESLVEVILLDADESIIRTRLEGRYQNPDAIEHIELVSGKSVQRFIDENVQFAAVLRSECVSYGVKIIDTSYLNPDRVADLLQEYLLA